MSARSLNKVMIIGNLTRDPNLRYTPKNTAVCSFGLATNRSWVPADGGEKQETVEFHNIVAWTKLAEICGQLLHKGDKVYVDGRLQTRDWKGEDGNDRRTTEIVIDNMILLRSASGQRYSADDGNKEASGANMTDDKGDGKSSESQKAKKTSKKKSEDQTKDESTQVEDIADDIPF
ncbi:single-stranded DNA-binding protein [Patescibacteria group bacterium]|nr:single-stranded DNA-binding protein [Patescibacteria group bacterium]